MPIDSEKFEELLGQVEAALPEAWSRRTSSDPRGWSPTNPAWGQCAATALLLKSLFGLGILRTTVVDVAQRAGVPGKNGPRVDGKIRFRHYLNVRPDGSEVDMTAVQFSKGSRYHVNEGEPRRRTLPFGQEVVTRSLVLRKRVDHFMGGGLTAAVEEAERTGSEPELPTQKECEPPEEVR